MNRAPVAARRAATPVLALLALLVALALAAPATHAQNREWKFRVFLDDREIGTHRFALREAGESAELQSVAAFDVRFLFVNAYRYRHEALERWDDDCLVSLAATTDSNGEVQRVKAVTTSSGQTQRLVVERASGRDEHEGCVMSFAYWNPRILSAKRLLNSQTGELTPVTIRATGEESVRVEGRPVTARRHRIDAGALQIDVWYADGRWVGLEAPAAGGRRLRYQPM